jgi:hypothetical protein
MGDRNSKPRPWCHGSCETWRMWVDVADVAGVHLSHAESRTFSEHDNPIRTLSDAACKMPNSPAASSSKAKLLVSVSPACFNFLRLPLPPVITVFPNRPPESPLYSSLPPLYTHHLLLQVLIYTKRDEWLCLESSFPPQTLSGYT